MKCFLNVKAQVTACGFCRMKPSNYVMPKKITDALGAIVAESRDMPVDPKAKNGERRRRYGRFVYLPWTDSLSLRPTLIYDQNVTVNKDHGGAPREFAPLTMPANNFLTSLIRLDFEQLPLADEQLALPWDVGVHLVQMFARPGVPGVSSPDRPHKDTEPYTFVHLLERQAVTGGDSAVFANAEAGGKLVPGDLLFEGTLSGTMDSLLVKDDAVFHQVKQVLVEEGADHGYRTVLLVDFTPMVPLRNEYPNLA
jgi:hypothetical protein